MGDGRTRKETLIYIMPRFLFHSSSLSDRLVGPAGVEVLLAVTGFRLMLGVIGLLWNIC